MSLRTDLEDPQARDRETKAAGRVKGVTACNRSACQAPLTDDRFWNNSTRAYYCRYCALKINRAAGHPLCVQSHESIDLHTVNPATAPTVPPATST